MKNFLIVLLGPTGVGKTDVSIDIAKYFNAEIISSDSRQFYKEMKIGTAVPDDDQLQQVQHHFIRFISVKDYYNSSFFERDVLYLLSDLFRKINKVIMTGGSGMYIDAVCNSIDNIPDVEPEIREKYINKFQEEGIESLRIALKLLDPVYYSKVDLKNHKRIMRALEICETSGRPYSSFLSSLSRQKKVRDFSVLKIGLQRPREDLYNRINQRVDKMISSGLEGEAKALCDLRKLNALNSVGYKEFFQLFDGKISYEQTIELIKRNTRRFAKRQMTWWSKDKDIRWFHPDQMEHIIGYIEEKIMSSNRADSSSHNVC
jgi:tRNA dimethylallyltransferase